MRTMLPPDRFALLDGDLRAAVAYLELGLLALNSIDSGNDRWHPAFLLLSFGTEKLGKLVILLNELEASGEFLTDAHMRKSYGHDLTKIRKGVIEAAERTRDGTPFWDAELGFVRQNATLGLLLELWTEFGKQGRYETINKLLAGTASETVEQGVRALENDFLRSDARWSTAIGKVGFESAFYPALNRDLTVTIQRYLRLQSSLFLLGLLGRPGQLISAHVGHWAELQDDRLGEPQARLKWSAVVHETLQP